MAEYPHRAGQVRGPAGVDQKTGRNAEQWRRRAGHPEGQPHGGRERQRQRQNRQLYLCARRQRLYADARPCKTIPAARGARYAHRRHDSVELVLHPAEGYRSGTAAGHHAGRPRGRCRTGTRAWQCRLQAGGQPVQRPRV